jgi:phage shock protein PspC (stress-responsive transcriptional regulator)
MLVIVSTQLGVEDTLKDFWATRPRRPRRGRKLAGVAAAIGRRYGIDPVIVRVAFVVATFYGGAGVLMYLLGWLLFPEQDDEGAPLEAMVTKRRSSMSSAFTVMLCLALLPAFWFFVDNEFAGIVGLAIVLGSLYLLHRSRGHLNRPVPAAAAPTEPAFAYPPAEFMAPTAAEEPPMMFPEPPRTAPPAWDPLGAAPFAWDLPEPTPPAPEPPAPRKRSRVGVMTVGIALIVAGGLAVASLTPGGAPSWLTPAHGIGILLAVIGLGLVAGAFARGGRGLIGIAVPLSVAGIALTAFSANGWQGVGDINERPTAISEVQGNYLRSAGDITLDLTALPDSGNVDLHVGTDAGDVTILVPKNADVDLNCEVTAGDLNCLGRSGGPGSEVKVREDYGSDGEGGLEIELDVEVTAGDVEVRRV